MKYKKQSKGLAPFRTHFYVKFTYISVPIFLGKLFHLLARRGVFMQFPNGEYTTLIETLATTSCIGTIKQLFYQPQVQGIVLYQKLPACSILHFQYLAHNIRGTLSNWINSGGGLKPCSPKLFPQKYKVSSSIFASTSCVS